MSLRGFILALQRLHDDTGFAALVCREPASTLGIYDLDTREHSALLAAIHSDDMAALREVALSVGMDWDAARLDAASRQVPGVESVAQEVTESGQRRVQKGRVRRKHWDHTYVPDEGHLLYKTGCPIPNHGIPLSQP